MIHNATVEVTCDRNGCQTSTFVPLPAGCRDTYIARDCTIEQELLNQCWVVDNGKHYCCEDCAHPEREHELDPA